MMKWGRKKPSSSSSSSSHSHFISHVFPLSWFSKFKQSSDKPTSGIIQKGKKNFERANPKSPKCCSSSYRDSRFYTQDDDGFWRLSFGEEGDKNSKKAVTNKGTQSKEATARDDSLSRTYKRIIEATSELERELGEVKEGYRKSLEKEIPEEIDLLHVMQMMRRANSRETETFHQQKHEKRGIPEEIDLLQANSRETERFHQQKHEKQRIAEEIDLLQANSRETERFHQQKHEKQRIPEEIDLLQVMEMIGRDNSRETEMFHQQQYQKQGISEEIDLLQANSRETERFHQQKHEKQGISQTQKWEQMKDAKIKELISKNDKQRNSFHIGLKQNKVRVRSPRTPSKTETCKIQAIENLKKAKMKKKMKEMTTMEEKAAKMESFAVVKCSRDPHQDFRESMIEMIVEKRIRRPEELEELLACYLTLNADEYHDLIIKVFRQVWCELEETYFDQKSPKEGYYEV